MVSEKFLASYYSPKEIEDIVNLVLLKLLERINPLVVILFGSAATDKMTKFSDLDIAVIVDNISDIKESYKKISNLSQEVKIPIDFLVIDITNYKIKSEIGGVFFEAKNFGRVIYKRKDQD